MRFQYLARAFALILALLTAAEASAQPFVYVTGQGQTGCSNVFLDGCRGEVTVFNLATGHVVAHIVVEPREIGGTTLAGAFISPDGKTVYTTFHHRFPGSGHFVGVIDTGSNTVSALIGLGSGFTGSPAFSPDGTRLYIPTSTSINAVKIVDLSARAVAATIPLSGVSISVALDAPRNRLYAAGYDSGTITVIDTASAMVVGTLTAGTGAMNVAVAPDGTRLYVAGRDKTIQVLALPSGTLQSTIPVSGTPERLTLNAAGSDLYVSVRAVDAGDTTGVAFISTASAQTTGFVPLAVAAGSTLSADGSRLFVAADRALATIDISARAIVATTDTVFGTLSSVALTPATTCVFEIPTRRLQFPNYGAQLALSVPAPAGCPWTATIPNATGFFTITGASSGTGPGSVQVSSAATSTTGRVETLSINGQAITLSETVPYMTTDTPANEAAVTEPFMVAGWALESDPEVFGTAVDAVHIYARPLPGGAPVFLGAADIGMARPDVAAAFGPQYLTAGWQFSVRSLPSGFYNIEAYMHTIHSGWVAASSRRYTITAAAPRTQILIDSIATGDTVTSPFLISGWAVDTAASSGTGVDTVHVWAYPADGTAPRFLGVANYGSQRGDIGQVFGGAFVPSGFALAGRLAPGAYTIVTFAHSTQTNTFANVATASITVSGAAQPIVIFTGGNRLGATGASSGSFSLSVAAIDERASTGAGVDVVHLWAYPVGGGSPLFLGASGAASANPIMAAAFGQQFLNCQFTISNQLPPAGTYDLVFFARSTVTGQFDIVRVKRYVSP